MKLKELRIKFKKTQGEVAKVLNIKKQNYQNYELGKRKITVKCLQQLAEFYNVSVDELIGIEKKNLIETPEKDNLLNFIEQLTEIECYKVGNYAEGVIMNRVKEQKNKTLEIIKKIEKEEE